MHGTTIKIEKWVKCYSYEKMVLLNMLKQMGVNRYRNILTPTNTKRARLHLMN